MHLREISIKMPSRNEALKRTKQYVKTGKYKNGKTKYLVHHECESCKELFRPEDVEVDHIEEVGSLDQPIEVWIERLFCDASNLQVLCISCHARKTAKMNRKRMYNRYRNNRDVDLI